MKKKYKIVKLEQLEKELKPQSYQEFVKAIRKKVEKGQLEPVKSSGTNGNKEPLHNKYRKLVFEYDEKQIINELFSLHNIDTAYYSKNPESYINEKNDVILLNNFLEKHKDLLKIRVSENERSFQIWGREKFLHGNDKDKGVKGKTILKHCDIDPKDLNIYETNTPLAYYSTSTVIPQNILILENCDPYYGMRQHLIDGNKTILGTEISTVIYGAGKGVSKSMRDLENCCSSYLSNPNNTYLYYGDLDYEGIQIFVDLKRDLLQDLDGKIELKPFKQAYLSMLEESKNVKTLPTTKVGQKSSERDNEFFSFFDENEISEMKKILEDRKYIPQEILNISKY